MGGVIAGAGMIIGSTLSGVGSIGIGFFNTPSAIAAKAQGKVWDEEKKDWILYNLETEKQVSILCVCNVMSRLLLFLWRN